MSAEHPLDTFARFILTDEPWRERAACRNKGALDLFFPKRGETQKPAKALCARCPVQVECDEYAVRSKTTYGIWGGKIRHRGPQPDKEAA